MVWSSREVIEHAGYHTTSATRGRQQLLADPASAEIVVNAIRYASESQRAYVLAYAVMPDHLHLLLVPRDGRTVSDVMLDIKRYSAKATAAGIDPLGFAWGPFAYAAGQVLDKAVTETKSLDHNKLADYMHKTSFTTVAGNFSFAKDGEWAKSRQVWTQFQNVQPMSGVDHPDV